MSQSPIFSTRREVVRVDVLVSANGQPVKGLRPSDFEIRDNGKIQQVELASFEEVPLNLVMTFDMSQSVDGERLEHLRRAGHTLLTALKPTDRASLVTFSHIVTQEAALTTERDDVRTALNELVGEGETALVDGIYASIVLGTEQQGRGLVIVFSDGVDTASWLSPEALIDTARRSDAAVYSVAAKSADHSLLRQLSTATGGDFFEIESTQQLDAVFLRILNEYRHRYLVSYSPQAVDQSGWHQLDVRVRNKAATVKARPGYYRGQ